jgi:hypothetical protein
MRKWIILVSLLILPCVAQAKIVINEITVIDDSEQLVMLGNLARSVADSMGGDPLVVTVCYSDYEREVCCSYIGGEASYSFDVYERGE